MQMTAKTMASPRPLLPPGWEVPQAFRDRLGDKVGRQRAMMADGHLLLVLHAPPKPEDDERVGRLFWRTPEGKWSSSDFVKGVAALEQHLAEYEEVLDRLDEAEDHANSADALFTVLEHLTPLHRSVRNLHQVMQEARKMVPADRDLINLRDWAYDIERTAELLFNEVKNSLDFAVARRAEEQARSSQRMATAAHRLNVLAAFFFPIATLSAVFGVNLEHGLETLHGPYLFLGLIAIGVITGALLLGFVTSRSLRG
jgi:Mg2+ and Co2+ transporter CorA